MWITEFAVADWSAQEKSQYTVEETKSFMSSINGSFESMDFIERYSWFGLNPTNDPALGPSALYNENSNFELTDLGELYASLPSGLTFLYDHNKSQDSVQ